MHKEINFSRGQMVTEERFAYQLRIYRFIERSDYIGVDEVNCDEACYTASLQTIWKQLLARTHSMCSLNCVENIMNRGNFKRITVHFIDFTHAMYENTSTPNLQLNFH